MSAGKPIVTFNEKGFLLAAVTGLASAARTEEEAVPETETGGVAEASARSAARISRNSRENLNKRPDGFMVLFYKTKVVKICFLRKKRC
jgi:outer membrane receptor protein involved in Fe transport